jgi:hypothetical protein
MRRIALLLAPLAVLGLAAAACGDDSSTVSSGGASSSTSSTSSTVGSSTTTVTDGGGAPTTTEPTTTPSSDGTVAIEVSQGGGFVPQGVDFGAVPTIVLADGRSFVGGAQTAQFPGSPLAPVLTGRLSATALRQLVAAAKAAGLDGRLTDFGQPGVSDMPSTTVRVVIDGREHTTSVYALDADGEAGGVSGPQRANRRAVADFVAKVRDAVDRAAGPTPLSPTGYEVLGFEVDPASAHQGEPAPNDLDWPFPDLHLDPTTCARVTGDRVATFAKALERATSITVWHARGAAYHLSIRATLPGRTDCP